MATNFRVPFFKAQRDKLALDLLIDAKLAADKANKSRTISSFIENYDIILDCFEKLSAMNGKVTSVKGNLFAERCRIESEFQRHFHDAIDRSGDEIVAGSKKLYKYDKQHTELSIASFKLDIDKFMCRMDNANATFAKAKYSYVCHECGMAFLLSYEDDNKAKRETDTFNDVDIESILRDEEDWRRRQQGISLVDSELSKIDSMRGLDFERWCAEMLRKNGFVNVRVTQGSGDQGVDVLAEKDGIKYAIQCKCYASDLGNAPVQEVNAGKAIYHCHVGVVMTNRFFTSGAKRAADATGVLLWDRNKIEEYIRNVDKD
jgi:HJR/Mrr/RecB family endonuclease